MAQTQVSGSGIKNNVITNSHLHSAANIAGSKLANSGVTAGSYGSGSATLSLTINAQGLITAASTNSITQVGGSNGVDFNDNVKARFGTGNDLKIWHDSSNSHINNTTGNLLIGTDGEFQVLNYQENEYRIRAHNNGGVDLYYNHSKKFETTSDGATVSGDLTIDGSTPELRMKVTSDAQSHRINFFNTADTIVARIFAEPSGNVSIRNGTNAAEECIKCLQNAAVELYFNNSKKFETLTDGVSIPNDNDKLKIGASQDLYLWHNGSTGNSNISNVTGDLFIQGNNGSGTAVNQIAIKSNAAVELNYQGTKKFETTNVGITVTGGVTASSFSGDGSNLTGISAFVSGMIIIWSGAEAAIPSGWVICDGNNSTPNLRARFVMGGGSGSGYSIGDIGGAASVTLTIAQIPSHSHTFNRGAYSGGTPAPANRTQQSQTNTTGSTGGGQSHENRPPYYVLCYIMKT